MKEFREKYRYIQINLNHYQTGQIVEKLKNDEVDIAFTKSFIPQDLTEWKSITLFSHPYCVFMNQEHHLAGKESVSMYDLEQEPFVMLDRKAAHKGTIIYFRLFIKHGFLPNIVVQAERIETVLRLWKLV